jgi:ribosomal protein L6P/L9E
LRWADGAINVNRASEQRHVRALHGTFRSLVQNLIIGVSEGFVKELEIKASVSVRQSRAKLLISALVNHTQFFTPFQKVSK